MTEQTMFENNSLFLHPTPIFKREHTALKHTPTPLDAIIFEMSADFDYKWNEM